MPSGNCFWQLAEQAVRVESTQLKSDTVLLTDTKLLLNMLEFWRQSYLPGVTVLDFYEYGNDFRKILLFRILLFETYVKTVRRQCLFLHMSN